MKDGERKASARKKSKGQEHIVKLIKSVSTVLVILILLFIMADKFGNITFLRLATIYRPQFRGQNAETVTRIYLTACR